MKKFLVVLIVILIIPIMVLSVVLFKKYRDDKPIIDNTIYDKSNECLELDVIKVYGE